MNDRPNPDALLRRVVAAEAREHRGKLTVFFGAAPVRMNSVRGALVKTFDLTRRSIFARTQNFVIVTCAVQVTAL